MGAGRITPLCFGILKRRVESCVQIWACNVPVRDHQASGVRRESEPVVPRLGSFFARWWKSARIRYHCARKKTKNDGANPSGSLVGNLWVSNVPFWEHQSSALGPKCLLAGARGLGSKMLLWLVCGRAFPAPPPHTGGMRQVLEPFLPPPSTPTRGRFLMDDFCLAIGSAFHSIAFLRVFLAP